MAVMKTCCGCFSTKSGTFAILLLYAAAYIAAIVVISINIKGTTYQDWYKESVLDTKDWRQECTSNTEDMDTWKCKTSSNIQYEIKGIFIGLIVAACIFFVADVVAIIGTANDLHWPILPWIIIEFIRLIAKLATLILVIILWAVNMNEGADTSYLIATSVIGAALMAFYFYVWLCVVSHFQTLKEINDLGLLDKGANGAVLPFVADDGCSDDGTCNTAMEEQDEDEVANDDKDEVESMGEPTKDDDVESPKDDGDKPDRPKSSTSLVEADKLIDAEIE